MEELSSLLWLGIVIVWFVTRFIRRAARRAARKQQTQAPPRPTVSRPTAAPGRAPAPTLESQRHFTGRGDKGPPPIVPR